MYGQLGVHCSNSIQTSFCFQANQTMICWDWWWKPRENSRLKCWINQSINNCTLIQIITFCWVLSMLIPRILEWRKCKSVSQRRDNWWIFWKNIQIRQIVKNYKISEIFLKGVWLSTQKIDCYLNKQWSIRSYTIKLNSTDIYLILQYSIYQSDQFYSQLYHNFPSIFIMNTRTLLIIFILPLIPNFLFLMYSIHLYLQGLSCFHEYLLFEWEE